jgi:adenylate kinase
LCALGQTSGRADDNEEVIKQRIKAFNELTKPVRDTYWQIGKVATISGVGEIEDIYANVRKAIVPSVVFLFGAPATV